MQLLMKNRNKQQQSMISNQTKIYTTYTILEEFKNNKALTNPPQLNRGGLPHSLSLDRLTAPC